jgi:hypothetical protein
VRRVLVGLIAVAVLVVALGIVRREKESETRPTSVVEQPTLLEQRMALGAVWLLGAGPALSLMPWVTGLDPGSYGDDVSHARVARDIVADGLSRGWIDSYVGGFPFGMHYPPLGHLVAAGLIGLGLPPLGAVNLLGALATAATPVVIFLALRLHVRPAHAAIGALYVAWIAPPNPFVGGLDAYFGAGVLSQALATPFCVAAASGVAHERHLRAGCLAAILASVTHPQLCLAGLAVGLVALTVSASREAWLRYVRIAAVVGVVMLSVYGPGLATLRVPFGWPPGLGWLQLGFPPDMLVQWFDGGALLDANRLPIATAVLDASLVALVLRSTDRRARAALATVATSASIAVSGIALNDAGRVGTMMLEVVQPLRALAWTPLAASAAVALALHLGAERIAPLTPDRIARNIPLALGALVALGLAAIALPERVEDVLAVRAYLAERELRACGPRTPPEHRGEEIRQWVHSLERGAFWFSPDPMNVANQCAAVDGLELESPVPVGVAGAMGAHVGLHSAAFAALDPTRSGSARRAAALGVGHVLLVGDETAPPGWLVRRVGSSELWSLEGGTSLAGATCLRERWIGDNASLRIALYEALVDPSGADALLSPDHAVELVLEDSALRRESIDAPCDARASVQVSRSASGLLEASVETDAPVDIVLRVTATASWTVRVDGEVTPWRMVAPGFLVVRVPAGTHDVVGETSWPRGYFLGLVVALALALSIAFAEPLLQQLKRRRRQRPERPT